MNRAVRWSTKGREQYDELEAAARIAKTERIAQGGTKSSKAEGLFKQVSKTINHLLIDPKHPGLHSHEFHSMEHPYKKDEKVWESYIQNKTPGAYRLFWCYGKEVNEITILAITPHP